MSNRVAVIGAGMTRFVRRAEESTGELASRAVEMALEDAGMTIDEIDAVCLGTAPDAFDGIHMKGEHLVSGAGSTNKPYMRHFVGGGTGVFSPIHGWMHVASGKFKNCLVVTEEKMSPCVPHPAGAFLTIFDHTTEQPLKLTLIHIFAIEMCRFMHQYGYSEEEIAEISVLCKKNALEHPAAQIAQEITVDDVMKSPLLSWPVKRLDISPTSDGAVAVVLANENVARSRSKTPVFIDGVGYRLDTAYWCTRDLAFPTYVSMAARDAYKMAGITKPEEQIDIFEPYDPFAYKALHHMNGLLMDRTGRKTRELFESGAFERDSSHPLCPSGGALGVGNPISATGLMKIADLYFQLSGQAGGRQVKKNAHRGIAQAWGDLMQVGTVVVMSSDGAQPGQKTMWSDMTPEDLPVSGIKKIDEVPNVKYTPNLRYSWDDGLALTTYLDGLRHGRIRGSHCSGCDRMLIPARSFCEICNLKPVDHWFDLPDTGTVETFTLSKVNWDSSPLPKGQTNIFAVIAIDCGTDKMGLVHRLGDVKPEDVKIGMRVKAVWRPEKEREGTITDISHFKPMTAKEQKQPIPDPVPIKPVPLTSETAGSFPGQIPMSYAYSAGLGGKRFYQDLAKGKVSGTWCSDCEAAHLPASGYCEHSMATLDPEQDAKEIDPKSGVVVAFTEVQEDRSGNMLQKPETVVQVAFDDSIGTIIGRVRLEEDQEVHLGLGVELVPTADVGPEHVLFRPL